MAANLYWDHLVIPLPIGRFLPVDVPSKEEMSAGME
jgi:hypothetical protein